MRVSIAVKRYHDHGSSYKGKSFIEAGFQLLRVYDMCYHRLPDSPNRVLHQGPGFHSKVFGSKSRGDKTLEPGRSRTYNLLIRSQTRYPLRHWPIDDRRHEVVLDRHGVYGLQRNLLVENIIDIYKQESTRPEKKSDQPMCEEHEDERINIYCLNCEVPTCSLCKVFGAHKDCQVAPLTHVFQRQKSELSDGIAVLVGSNDRVQGVISQLEDTCKTIEECCRKQKQDLCEKFDYLYGILEERKTEMTQAITRTQEEKLEHVRALIRKYSDHLENVSKLVESGIQFMDEPEMAVFLQNAKTLLQKIAEASKAFQMEKVEQGYEIMSHFTVNLNREEKIIREIDFYR
ncbi:hypothetical protein STEG23_037302, partial [Scotinomys teguina]